MGTSRVQLAKSGSKPSIFLAGAFAVVGLSVWIGVADAADAPNPPGTGSAWTTGAKQGIGTSTTAQSKVWFTIAQGITDEVYYPRVDLPNVQDLQFVVTDHATFVDVERDATNHEVVLPNPRALTYRQINTAKSGRYRITKTYVTDVDRPTLLIETRFEVLSGGPYDLFVLYNPSLSGSGMGDTAATEGDALVASDGDVASALVSSMGFAVTTNGYSGTSSDGLYDLSDNRNLDTTYDSASVPGNVVQFAQVRVGNDTTFALALGFGTTRQEAAANARASLASSFAAKQADYENGWQAYLSSLNVPGSVSGSDELRTQYNVAMMALKAGEDKTYAGASIAALATPWGEVKNADRCCPADIGGYQAVWARDLYQIVTAQIAAGDSAAANRGVDFLFDRQQLPDGSFPHNSRVDGTQFPNFAACGFACQQLDETAFPIILAQQLGRTDGGMWAKIKKAADFIISRGPYTPQERWEEESGFSPSTIAAEIAGLVCAADIAAKNADMASANAYLAKADEWQQKVANWTFTTTGPLGDARYYIRIDQNQDPNDGQILDINNGGGAYDERAIVDAGFLELVRLGVMPADNPHIAASLPEIDSTIRTATPSGDMWYRYNHDGYGEQANGAPFMGVGIGRLWPLLSGERGEYELARGGSAVSFLATMARAGNQGFMIPEQVWNQPNGFGEFTFGEGTGSATPLAWSMAQFVRLAFSIDVGRPVETPQVVAARYTRSP